MTIYGVLSVRNLHMWKINIGNSTKNPLSQANNRNTRTPHRSLYRQVHAVTQQEEEKSYELSEFKTEIERLRMA